MKKFYINSFGFKIIAVITMFIDHIGVLLKPIISYNIYRIFRCIGRIAFPLFCFMLVEGFRYSKDRFKYLRNLFIFALISEIPSDLFFRSLYTMNDELSIFSTLFIGLLSIILIDRIQKKCVKQNESIISTILITFIVIGSLFLGDLIKVEYGWTGILLILMIYIFQNNFVLARKKINNERMLRNIFICISIVIWAILYDLYYGRVIELYAIISGVMVLFYNGERGSYKISKWVFYAFYPLHLIILILLRDLVVFG